MMGSSPMHSHEPGHIPTEQELAEQAARGAVVENDHEQSLTTNPEAVEVASDAKTDTSDEKLYGKYPEAKVKELLAGGLENLTDAQIAKLSRTGQLNSAGQSNISKARSAELNSTLEARKRASEEKPVGGIKAFEGDYFKNLGITEPTDAEYRVMQRAYKNRNS